jgi:hypothetical protein
MALADADCRSPEAGLNYQGKSSSDITNVNSISPSPIANAAVGYDAKNCVGSHLEVRNRYCCDRRRSSIWSQCLGVALLHGGFEWRVGASMRYGSGDADEFGLPELTHSVERFDRDCNLGRTSGVVA